MTDARVHIRQQQGPPRPSQEVYSTLTPPARSTWFEPAQIVTAIVTIVLATAVSVAGSFFNNSSEASAQVKVLAAALAKTQMQVEALQSDDAARRVEAARIAERLESLAARMEDAVKRLERMEDKR